MEWYTPLLLVGLSGMVLLLYAFAPAFPFESGLGSRIEVICAYIEGHVHQVSHDQASSPNFQQSTFNVSFEATSLKRQFIAYAECTFLASAVGVLHQCFFFWQLFGFGRQ